MLGLLLSYIAPGLLTPASIRPKPILMLSLQGEQYAQEIADGLQTLDTAYTRTGEYAKQIVMPSLKAEDSMFIYCYRALRSTSRRLITHPVNRETITQGDGMYNVKFTRYSHQQITRDYPSIKENYDFLDQYIKCS